jgi:hypothetical protein
MGNNRNKSASEEWKPRKWVIPPGLNRSLNRFAVRCQLIIEDFLKCKSRPLLIHGPTGVGKSLFSEYFIWEFQKKTKNKDVVFVNCAAIPDNLLESELFGYERGSHNTAFDRKIGFFEKIGDGVIVLEEIGEMAKHLQAKLLMVIENKIFYRLGSTEKIPFRAQIVATSNVDKKKYRKDFMYRFNGFFIPPIHERREDILYYINYCNPDITKNLTKGAVLSLLSYNWPGNVREIEHVCNAMFENFVENYAAGNYREDLFGPKYRRNALEERRMIMQIDNEFSDYKFNRFLDFASKLKKSGINIFKIESVLQSNLLSFEPYAETFYQYERILGSEVNNSEDDDEYFGVERDELFDLAYNGFLVFCKLFFQDEKSNDDILSLAEFIKYEEGERGEANTIFKEDFGEIIENGFDIHKIKSSENKDIIKLYHESVCLSIHYADINSNIFWPMRYRMALLESLKYVSGINDINLNDIDDLNKLSERNKDNIFLNTYFNKQIADNEFEEIPIEDVAYSDLKGLYYETLCSKIGFDHGSKTRIAEITRLSKGSISQYFSKPEVREKFSNPNFYPRKRLIFLK